MYKDGDLVRSKGTFEIGIIIKRYHPCTDFWHVALPSGIEIIHGVNLEPLETKCSKTETL
jgi:hypothetical protein